MLENIIKTNLLVDSKDLACPICYLPFGSKENVPISLCCGHTFCSICLPRLDRCAICKAQFCKRQKLNKSVLLCSLLETHSQVKRCAVHQKALEGLCLEKKKLVCFDCLATPQEIIPIKDVEEKVEEIAQILARAEESYLFLCEQFINFLKRVDVLLHQETCYAPVLKERLYQRMYNFMVMGNYTEPSKESLQGWILWMNRAKIMLEKWRNNPQDEGVAMEILETKLEMEDDLNNLLKIFAESRRELTEKQNQLWTEIAENRELIKCLSRKIKRAFERSSEMTLDKIPFDLEKIYLDEIFAQFGLTLGSWSKKKVTSGLKKFNSMFFDCRINFLSVLCNEGFDSEVLAILGSILESIPTLESFTIILSELWESDFCLLSTLLLKIRNLKEFSIELREGSKCLLQDLRDDLEKVDWFWRKFYFQLTTGFVHYALKAKLKEKFRVNITQ